VGVGLVRLGLVSNLLRLANDERVDHLAGGIRDRVRVVRPRDGGLDTSEGQTCHRVDFDLDLDGVPSGEASLCVADATGLPVLRTQKLRLEGGEQAVTETFRWTLQ
jgi:hypothetical protein